MFRVVVQRDHFVAPGGARSSERYVLQRGRAFNPATFPCEPGVQDLGETNSSDPETLREFVETSIGRFPARRYWLVVAGHGDAWLGAGSDVTDAPGRLMPLPALAAGLRSALDAKLGPGSRLDVIQFDACQMASLEAAYELSEVADFMVASQEAEPAEGHPYGAFYWLEVLAPGSHPKAAVAQIVEDYVKAYHPDLSPWDAAYVGKSITSVALNLRNLAPTIQAFAGLSQAVMEAKPEGFSCADARALRANADSAVAGTGIEPTLAAAAGLDLGAFLNGAADPTGTFAPFPGAQDLARTVRDELIDWPSEEHNPHRGDRFILRNGFPAWSPIVAEAHHIGVDRDLPLSGLTVLWPRSGQRLVEARLGGPALDAYRALRFDVETGWSRLLDACWRSAQACAPGLGSLEANPNCDE